MITASVGVGGVNRKVDVKQVQERLNPFAQRLELDPLAVDGDCGPKTRAEITAFQDDVLGMEVPDGRVDPGGRTWQQLDDAPRPAPVISPRPAAGPLAALLAPGPRTPLSPNDFECAAAALACDVPAIRAVAKVESSRKAFDDLGRPTILYGLVRAHQAALLAFALKLCGKLPAGVAQELGDVVQAAHVAQPPDLAAPGEGSSTCPPGGRHRRRGRTPSGSWLSGRCSDVARPRVEPACRPRARAPSASSSGGARIGRSAVGTTTRFARGDPVPDVQLAQGHLQRPGRPCLQCLPDPSLVGKAHAAFASPACRSSAAVLGSRPRNALNTSIGCRLPPSASTVSRKRRPVAATARGSSSPASSNAENASADSTSAHL